MADVPPTPQSLGIAAGSRVLLYHPPEKFQLPALPEGVTVHYNPRPGDPFDVIICFCPTSAHLIARWPWLPAICAPGGVMWVAWPKPSRRRITDLSERYLRDYVRHHDWVDCEIIDLDSNWKALRHVRPSDH